MDEDRAIRDTDGVVHVANAGYGSYARTACGEKTALWAWRACDGHAITCIRCVAHLCFIRQGMVFDHGRGKWVR